MTYYQDSEEGTLEMKNPSQNKTFRGEIMSEIENRLNHTDDATLITILAALKDGFDERQPSPFDWLPDEMIMNIIRMTISDLSDQRHCHLVDNIAKISRRFKNLAADMSLSKGHICVDGDEVSLKEVIHKFLGSEVEELEVDFHYVDPNDVISAEDISSLLEKCPNIKRIKLNNWSGSRFIYTRHDMMKLLLRCPGFGLVPVNGTVPELPVEKEGRPVQCGLREEVIYARPGKICEKKMKDIFDNFLLSD